VYCLSQNASGLYLSIQKIGCFFRAACNIAEDATGKALNVVQLNKIWDVAHELRYINANDCVINSAAIANLALKELKNYKGLVYEVGTFRDGEVHYYPSIPEGSRRGDYFIQKISQNGPSKTHFRRVDKFGNVLFEPHYPAINPTGVYYTIIYRYGD